MAYLPLYRKYRPQTLQELVGQEHVKQALSNAIELGKISHAYLFTGPRGTGKTSTARIFAKSLNCQKGITLTPCGECPSCLDIQNSNPIDVIEIDAASNRSVDDARNILEKVQYVPVNGRYKIYIIDEVHMLTKEAFNTLLKTLEEPPKNVIFILATTEIQKVLETIISRCQRFDFRRISSEDIFEHLKEISEKENIDIEEDALKTIAKTSSGGMRDALSLLDQVSVINKKITVDDINSLLGRLSFDVLNKLVCYIENSDIQGAIEFTEKIYNSGNEAVQILTNLLGYLKNLLVAKNTSNKEILTELTQLNTAQVSTLKKHNLENHQITFLIERVAYYIKELKASTNLQLWLEVAIIDIAGLAENTRLLDLQDRIARIEIDGGVGTKHEINLTKKVEISKPIIQPTSKQEQKNEINLSVNKNTAATEKISTVDKPVEIQNDIVEKQETTPSTEQVISSVPADLNIQDLWMKFLQNITSTPTVSLLSQHAAPMEISEQQIVVACKEKFSKMISSDTKKKAMENGAKSLYGKSVTIVIKGIPDTEFLELQKKNNLKQTPKSKPLPNRTEPKIQEKTELKSNNESKEEIQNFEDKVKEIKKEKPEEKYRDNSEQVNMVIDLFNGKIIE